MFMLEASLTHRASVWVSRLGVLFVHVRVYVPVFDGKTDRKRKPKAHSGTQLAISNQMAQTLPQAF